MATCPKCGGFLDSRHRCWGGRRRIGRAGFAAIGAIVGFIVGSTMVKQPAQLLLPFVTAALGAVITWAVRRYARF